MHTIRRRQLLASAAGGLLLAPFYSMLNGEPALAQTAKKAKRLLIFGTMGTKPDMWTPKFSGESITQFSAMTAAFADAEVRDKIVLIEGLPAENVSNNHGAPDAITGMGNGYYAVNNVQQLIQSVDQFVADGLVKAGVRRPISSLILGAETSGANSMFFRAGKNLPPIASPTSAFNSVFSSIPMVGGMTPTGPDPIAKRRKSILDLITAEAKELQSRVGAADRSKLESHLESIRELENKLGASSGGGGGGNVDPGPVIMCTPPGRPTDSTSKSPLANNLLHLDIIVNAFACDITRVASIQWGTDQTMQVDLPTLKGEQHNGFIHSGAGENFKGLVALEAWQAEQFVNLLKALKKKPEPTDPSQTLFDSTLVVWARDMGDAVDHNMKSMRFVLAGGAGGYLKTGAGGRYIHDTSRHERVLLTMAAAMGITDFKGFGDPKLATKTPLPSLIA